jgi:hypothetical protein
MAEALAVIMVRAHLQIKQVVAVTVTTEMDVEILVATQAVAIR